MQKNNAGRPPKNLLKRAVDRKGILPQPSTPCQFELVHDNIDLFKNIFECTKRVNLYATLKFTPEGLQVFASKNKCIDVLCEIYGSKIVGYYGATTGAYKVACTQILRNIKDRDKECKRLSFIVADARLKISFISDFKVDTFNIKLEPTEIPSFNLYEEKFANLDVFDLSFDLPWDSFKKTIARVKHINSDAKIIFEKEENIAFKIYCPDKELDFDTQYRDETNTINMRHNGVFTAVCVPVLTLNCVTQTILDRMLHFYISETETFVIYSKLDEIYTDKKTPVEGSEAASIKFYIDS